MIDHVTIYVNDLAKSRSFYEKLFAPFDYKISFGDEKNFWAFNIGNAAFIIDPNGHNIEAVYDSNQK